MPDIRAIALLVRKAARNLARAFEPDANLKKRVQDLALCGSAENRRALAEECMRHGMYAEATQLYESTLEGALAKDGALLFGYARAAVEGGDWDKAAHALGRLRAHAPKTRPLEARLLQARLAEGRGEHDAALVIYREIIPMFFGLEARFRCAELLLRLDQRVAASGMFDEVIVHSKRFAPSVEDEQRWAAAARQAATRLARELRRQAAQRV